MPSLIFSIILLFFCNFLAAQYNLVYVDADKVIMQMQEYKVVKKELESYREKLSQKLEDTKKVIAKFYVKTNEDIKNGILNPKQKMDAEKELQDLQNNLDLMTEETDRKILAKEKELSEPVFIKFEAILKYVAKENQFELILDKKYLLHADDLYDATDKVLKHLN